MTKIRYSYIKNIVNSLYINLKISAYPIEMKNIFSNFKNCKVISYSKHMKKYNLSEAEVLSYFGSDEGCTVYNPQKNRYIVFYNDLYINYKTPARRRWTIAHELGHIMLRHLMLTNKVKIFRNNLSDNEYDWLEAEANRFASLLLANPIILHELKIEDHTDIIKICKLSEEASIYRFDEYKKWIKYKYKNKEDKTVLDQFYNFLYRKNCKICSHGFISEHAKYCPVCGYNELIWGDGKMKYKKGIPLDVAGHALICPQCENEEINTFDMYCEICGAYLFQECTGITEYDINGVPIKVEEGCGKIENSNARYCNICGNKTTFYLYGYLKDWQEEKSENEVATSSDDFIPFKV